MCLWLFIVWIKDAKKTTFVEPLILVNGEAMIKAISFSTENDIENKIH